MTTLARALLMAAAVFGILVALVGLAATLGGGAVALPGLGIIVGGPFVLVLGLVITFAALMLRRRLGQRQSFP